MGKGMRAVVMGWLALIALVCGCSSRDPTTRSPLVESQPPEALVESPPVATTETVTILRDLVVDLDGDEVAERVTATVGGNNTLTVQITQQGSSGNIWEHSFAENAELVSLQAMDLNADSILEVLVSMMEPNGLCYNLALIRWTKEGGHLLSPIAGPSSGSQYIQSLYYPAWVVDLDGDTGAEIVASVRSDDATMLHSVVYEWNGHTYAYTEFYILPPRPIPTTFPQP